MKSDAATLVQRVAQLEAAVAALRDRVATLEAPRPDNSMIVSALFHVTRDRAFSSVEVLRHSELLGGELRDLLQRAGLSTPQKLGKFLRRVAGRPIAGLVLERIGQDHDGAIWIFRRE